MPTSLTTDAHLAAFEAAGARLVALVESAGLEAPVPTCPTWRARDLLAHVAMVHRWAAANVLGESAEGASVKRTLAEVGDDLLGYYRAGVDRLVEAIRHAPVDLKAMTFLADAPAPRAFWARRQAHETTIHMVDGLAASLGRWPRAEETGIDQSLAVDGIDELVRGFFTRGRSKLFDGTEYDLLIAPTDADRRWLVHVAERLTVEPGDPALDPSEVACCLTGTAVQLYTGLWNRGEELQGLGREDVLAAWRANQRVRWS